MLSPALPSTSDRLALQRAHIALLHPRGSRGKVCTARAGRDGHGWDEGLVSPSSKAISEQLASAEVEYVGMLRYSGRRHSACVTGIGTGFQDLDYYREGLPYADASAEEVAALIMAAHEAAGIPRVSFVEDSGRGAYPVWLFAGMDGNALPRWQLAMRNLRGPVLDADGNLPKRRGKIGPKVEAFEQRMLPLWRLQRDLGLDRGAIDPARVLRVMGAINPKSGRMAHLAWPSAIQDIERVNFDAWCDALMPYTRAEMRQLRTEREAWKAANSDRVPAPRGPRRPRKGSKWVLIGEDLDRLLDHRGAAWFRIHKKRDWWVFLRAIAIAMTEGGCAQEWAERLAPRIGLPVAEAAASLSGVERGMRAAGAGERREWKGADRPAFYDYAYSTIADRLLVDEDVAREAGLRVLVMGGAAPLSPAERQRASRTVRNPLRATRDAQVEDRIGWGVYARLMRLDGATYPELVEAFGRSEDTIRKAIRAADAEWTEAEAILSAASTSETQAIQTPDDVSPSIVVSDPIETPPAAEPAPAPAATASTVTTGEVRVHSWTRFLAEISTATGRWEWTRIDGVWGKGFNHVEMRLLTSAPGGVSPADAALAEQASQDLLRASSKPARRSPRAERRRAYAGRPEAVRVAPLPPLDLQREAELYREASGGGGLRHRRALVAA